MAASTASVQAWIAVVGGLGTVILGLLKYFDYRSRRDRQTLVGQAFTETVNSLASDDEIKRLAAAILLRRFFDRRTEQGAAGAPYQHEAIRVIAALLRAAETGEFQKLLGDGLAHAPSLCGVDLQRCNLTGAYLGEGLGRKVDLSEADLYQADLTQASLKNAVARETVFYRAVLAGTVLEGADLTGADLREADLAGARFAGAVLDGARFEGALNPPPEIEALTGTAGHPPPPGRGMAGP